MINKRLINCFIVILAIVCLSGCTKKTFENVSAKSETTCTTKDEVTSNDIASQQTTLQDVTPQETTSMEVEEGQIIAVFNITIPEPIPEGYYITMGCNLTGWDPTYNMWPVEKVDETHYRCVMDLTNDLEYLVPNIEATKKDGKLHVGLQYKWVLQRPGLYERNMWSMVEISKANCDINNRVVFITDGANVFNDTVGRFKGENEEINNEPTVVGELVCEKIQSDGLLRDKDRTVRVWLPKDYDKNNVNKKYPVYYMHDGQNLFDRCTSFAGEWMIDETVTKTMENAYEGCIVVGIDSIGDEQRMEELSPTFTDEIGTGENYAKFIVEKVKPYIDSNYNTKPEREFTAIGGSSMGGVMSFYMSMEYANIFGKTICFSTALVYYPDNVLIDFINNRIARNNGVRSKICIYCGGVGLNSGLGNDERSITKYVDFLKTNLIKYGYNENEIYSFIDENAEHSESAWSKYFPNAFKWLEGMTN